MVGRYQRKKRQGQFMLEEAITDRTINRDESITTCTWSSKLLNRKYGPRLRPVFLWEQGRTKKNRIDEEDHAQG
jgi:hypothetical protein